MVIRSINNGTIVDDLIPFRENVNNMLDAHEKSIKQHLNKFGIDSKLSNLVPSPVHISTMEARLEIREIKVQISKL